ncbi:MAG: glycosyltransferase [Alphaproteobacteria bacterium]|nr:glycosyltransferase [Alphaproteobacteria bacterium]
MTEFRRIAPLVDVTHLSLPAALDLTIVVPVYDEEESIGPLLGKLFPILESLKCTFEVLVVNDGSHDGSIRVLRDFARQYPSLRVIEFRRNYGQTAALMAGFDNARGDVIVTLDADLQNDPADIPEMMGKLREGFDVVSGWRADRQDATLSRKIPSKIANFLISTISGVKLRDYGCTLKAYRRDVMENVRLYGEMHRLIPIYASWMGAKVVEIPVRHHARKFGRSKYGLGRVLKVILDLTVVKFLESYLVKPIYIFGGFGVTCILLSFGALGLALANKFIAGVSLILTPLPLLAAMLFLMGCTSILMGLLAEMVTRTYFEAQDLRPYLIRERINFEPAS